jgi:3-hydroxyisobutyrate dehydrogenase
MNVAFLGLGVMGGGMAARLVSTGLPVTVWNRRRDRADAIVAQGARLADSPREAASTADVVISMVADDRAARAVWMGPDGAIAGARPGAVLIESSTVSPAWIAELSAAAAARGCALLDAPVTGSKTHAASGQLLFLVGGDEAALERARPVLDAMARGVRHLGPSGRGATLKLVNNFLCAVQAAALAEGIAMVERSGLDVDVALAILADGAPGSPLVKAVGPRMRARDYTVHFALELLRKDVSYAMAEAERLGLTLATGAAARESCDRAIRAGLGDKDFSALVEPLR